MLAGSRDLVDFDLSILMCMELILVAISVYLHVKIFGAVLKQFTAFNLICILNSIVVKFDGLDSANIESDFFFLNLL